MTQRTRGRATGRRSIAAVVLLMVGVLGLPGTAPAARYPIKAVEDPGVCDPRTSPCWGPHFRHINKADVVVWKNPAANKGVHDVTAINKKKWKIEKTLFPGDRAKRRFRRNGTYKYRCVIHSRMVRRDGRRVCKGMCGVVHVGN